MSNPSHPPENASAEELECEAKQLGLLSKYLDCTLDLALSRLIIGLFEELSSGGRIVFMSESHFTIVVDKDNLAKNKEFEGENLYACIVQACLTQPADVIPLSSETMRNLVRLFEGWCSGGRAIAIENSQDLCLFTVVSTTGLVSVFSGMNLRSCLVRARSFGDTDGDDEHGTGVEVTLGIPSPDGGAILLAAPKRKLDS